METPCNGAWFKLGEAAHVLGVSEITLRRKIKSDKIPYELREGKYYVYLVQCSDGKYITPTEAYWRFQKATLPYDNDTNNNVTILTQQIEALYNEITYLQQLLAQKEDTIRMLHRTIEDQQTLIATLEETLEQQCATTNTTTM